MVVAGARPNFVKINLLVKKLKKIKRFETFLVHTGQHYDFNMSEIFFRDLNIPKPDVYLNVGWSASQAGQTAKIMVRFESLLLQQRPDLVIVVGDVNSTLACSIASAKLRIPVAHVEAGLRSFDRSMPEEINRVVTDTLSSYLFVTEKDAISNLLREGISKSKIHFVGNTMIDTLVKNQEKILRSDAIQRFRLKPQKFAVITLHRPSNVDSKRALLEIQEVLRLIAGKISLIYPVHPRSRHQMVKSSLWKNFLKIPGLKIVEPLGYVDFMSLVYHSKFVLTDSGGIQEETTFLKIPCLTMRENTERPVTLKDGTNVLVGRDLDKIKRCVEKILLRQAKKSRVPKFWNGKTCERIVAILKKVL